MIAAVWYNNFGSSVTFLTRKCSWLSWSILMCDRREVGNIMPLMANCFLPDKVSGRHYQYSPFMAGYVFLPFEDLTSSSSIMGLHLPAPAAGHLTEATHVATVEASGTFSLYDFLYGSSGGGRRRQRQ